VGSELAVDLSHSLNLGLNLFLVEGVKEDLHVLLAIEGNSGGLASDGGGVALLNIILFTKKSIQYPQERQRERQSEFCF
jgi:hypothetical protein